MGIAWQPMITGGVHSVSRPLTRTFATGIANSSMDVDPRWASPVRGSNPGSEDEAPPQPGRRAGTSADLCAQGEAAPAFPTLPTMRHPSRGCDYPSSKPSRQEARDVRPQAPRSRSRHDPTPSGSPSASPPRTPISQQATVVEGREQAASVGGLMRLVYKASQVIGWSGQ